MVSSKLHYLSQEFTFSGSPPLSVVQLVDGLQVLVALGNGEVHYLEIRPDGLEEIWKFDTGDEVSCLDITPFGVSSLVIMQ